MFLKKKYKGKAIMYDDICIDIRCVVPGSVENLAVDKLRHRILRAPLKLSDFEIKNYELEFSADVICFAAYAVEELVGCIFLLPEGGSVYKLRQVAVDTIWQGKGIGKLLVEHGLKELESIGASQIYCHSREYAQEFYAKLGFEVEGDVFYEVSLPHIKMIRYIV